ncbi:hypothetical protein UCDDA912_g07129 [Diaporthe ampelina]|uniref:LysM domain-containing protein n=1 Tax=Diaporthe ampelina TaxID=1214573 RepID=A0A0G2FFL2_9PEZI|nr:hypothetical protein UCDDA912_g07129 [Diaporthe ampelina]
MHSIIIQWLLAGAVAAVATGKARRQDGPIDPGTAADCTYWETALDTSYTCVYYQDIWGISAAELLDSNPGVKADCSGIKVGNAHCAVENDNCDKIVRAYSTFIFANFQLWNSDVKPDCSGLWNTDDPASHNHNYDAAGLDVQLERTYANPARGNLWM